LNLQFKNERNNVFSFAILIGMESIIDIPKSLANFLLFIKKSKIQTIFTIIIVSGVIAFFYFSRQKKYEGQFTVLSSKVPFQFIQYIFKPIENSIANNQQIALKDIMDANEEDLISISSIGLEEIKGLQNLDFKNGFTISMEGNDLNALRPFGESCVNFLNQNEFINEWKKVYTDNLNELERTTSEQISRLDSVQRMIPSIIGNYNNSPDFKQTNFDIGSIYEQMVVLKEKREELIREIKFNREFKVISTTFFQKTKFSLKTYLLALIFFNVIILWLVYLGNSLISKTKAHM